MQILTYNTIVNFYGKVERGVYDADPSRELYKITNGEQTFYAVTEGFDLYEVEAMPEDYKDGTYCYTPEKGFYKNEIYKEPFNAEKEVETLKKENAELKVMLDAITTGINAVTGGK